MINKKLIQLWAKRPAGVTDYIPQFYPKYKKQETLVVGLNPSFSEKGYHSFLKNTPYSHWLTNLNERFSYEHFITSNLSVKDFIKIEEISKQTYKYYIKFSEIAPDWQYIDLFHLRVTAQSTIKELLKQKSPFLEKQLDLTLEHIQTIQPKIILVVNGLASEIFRQKCDLNFNEDWGTHSINGIPIFLSGMLTGAGVIDKGAFRRLQWHYKYVLSQI